MGIIWLFVLGGAVTLLFWRLGVPRAVWSIVGAAIMLGATGYALQGRPQLGGAPREAGSMPIDIEPGLVEMREAMFGRFTGDGAYMIAADALTRSGDTQAAAQVILGGIRHVPGSVMLWTGLGDTLARNDGDQVSPSALFAFQQAMRLGPKHPGPPFFLGLAYVRAGQLAAAAPYWQRAVALCPRDARYRPLIAERLGVLKLYLQKMEEQR